MAHIDLPKLEWIKMNTENKVVAAAGLNPNYVHTIVRNTSFGEALMWAKERGHRIARSG